MSYLMTAGKKAAQAIAAKESKKKKTAVAKSAAANRSSQAATAAAGGPPVSSPMISVWHWLLDDRPTTIMYCKPKKEVWYNGYLLDTYDGFHDDDDADLSQEVGDVVDFDVFSTDSQRCHRGRIERIPLHELSSPACESSDRLVIGSHRLWVDDCQIPEYTAGNASATQYSAADYFQDHYYYDDADDDDDEYSLGGNVDLASLATSSNSKRLV